MLFALCVVAGTGSVSSWPQTGKQSKASVPSVLNSPPDANPKYFPIGIFGQPSHSWGEGDFRARWYSSYLRAMHEPSLSDASKDTSLVAYRFLWLRTFHHPIAIRVSIRPDGTASLTGKVTSGAGGYEAGAMTWDESFELSKAQVDVLSNLLKRAGFWTLPTGDSRSGLDGAEWIMEGVQNGAYHVVDRWSPEKSDYANMCLYLVNLSKIQLKANEIY
jgi:hypothetical protein